jgi:hypothetical protein
MKYILLISGTKAGVDNYVAWSKKDIDAHMAVLNSINKELTDSGEFVGTEGLASPNQAVVVRGQKAGMPITYLRDLGHSSAPPWEDRIQHLARP